MSIPALILFFYFDNFFFRMFTYSLLGVFLLVGCWRPAVAMEDLDSILHKVGHEIQEVRDHLVSLHHRLHNLLDLAHRGIAHASKIKKIANDNKDKPVTRRERTTFDRFVDPNVHTEIYESIVIVKMYLFLQNY